MFCIVVMEKFGCAEIVSNPGAEYSIYASTVTYINRSQYNFSTPTIDTITSGHVHVHGIGNGLTCAYDNH